MNNIGAVSYIPAQLIGYLRNLFSVDITAVESYSYKLPNSAGRNTVKGRIEIDRERCKGCGLCIAVCPTKRIEISEDLNSKGYYPARFKEKDIQDSRNTGCTACSLCAVTCPDIAIEVYRQTKDESKEG